MSSNTELKFSSNNVITLPKPSERAKMKAETPVFVDAVLAWNKKQRQAALESDVSVKVVGDTAETAFIQVQRSHRNIV